MIRKRNVANTRKVEMLKTSSGGDTMVKDGLCCIEREKYIRLNIFRFSNSSVMSFFGS